jgi:opine dehydrogenase
MRAVSRLEVEPLQICVIGFGNLGQSQAGHLASLGHSVRLYNRSAERLAGLGEKLELALTGAASLRADLELATTDLAAALEDVPLIFVDVPAPAHEDLARQLAPLLKDRKGGPEPLIVLHPGGTLGAVHFGRLLAALGVDPLPPICELQTALYTARASGPGSIALLAIKQSVAMAMFPGQHPSIAAPLCALYPQIALRESTLETGLSNVQAFFHPALCVFNLARIEGGQAFRIYREGLSPAAGVFLARADEERLAIARAFGVVVPTAVQWFEQSYGITGATPFEAAQRVPAYEQLQGPRSLDTRLLWEDVPTGLVPVTSLARAAGVKTPALDGLLSMVAAACGPAILARGWTLERLGLAGLSLAELKRALG